MFITVCRCLYTLFLLLLLFDDDDDAEADCGAEKRREPNCRGILCMMSVHSFKNVLSFSLYKLIKK